MMILHTSSNYNHYKNLLAFIGVCAVVMLPVACRAQDSTSPPSLFPSSPELFPAIGQPDNTATLINLWDGVDDDGDLCVFVSQASVLDDVGAMRGTSFPPSPNFIDMDNDGLNDLVVGDGYGFVWVYRNSGEKGKPNFTTGEFLHTFTGWNSRVHMADWDQDGDYDLIIGTFYGDICVFENTGTRQQYKFNRGMGVPRYIDPRHPVNDARDRLPQVKLGKNPMVLGIYMAPWVVDWNGDQKPDLIFGEGTYSANSARIAFNKGSRGKPSFVEESLFFLAYGEGAEQLTPAVVDYNGDGINDLIMGTRTGEIRLYKGTKETVDPKNLVAALRSSLAPAILEFDGILEIAGKKVWDTMTYVYPCDWNEDELFDLLLASTRGKLYVAQNTGTKTQPVFPAAVPIKGTNTEKDMLGPAAWTCGIGGACNAALLLSSETEVVLTQGAPPLKPTAGERFMYFRYIKDYFGWVLDGGWMPGARSFGMNTASLKMTVGKRYQFSFDSVLRGKPASWRLRASELVSPGTDTHPPVWAHREVSDTVVPSGSWQKRSYSFTCPGLHKTNELHFNLWFQLPEGDCTFMLDNFSLKEVSR